MSAGSRAVYLAFAALGTAAVITLNVFEPSAWGSLASYIFGSFVKDAYLQTYLLDGLLILIFYTTAFLSIHSISGDAVDGMDEA
jgi:hypothetical protein